MCTCSKSKVTKVLRTLLQLFTSNRTAWRNIQFRTFREKIAPAKIRAWDLQILCSAPNPLMTVVASYAIPHISFHCPEENERHIIIINYKTLKTSERLCECHRQLNLYQTLILYWLCPLNKCLRECPSLK